MKTRWTWWLAAWLLAGSQLGAEIAAGSGAEVAAPASARGSQPAAASAETNRLCLNFRNTPLELVLDYLADAAGFVIQVQTEIHGTVEVYAKEPVSRDEAVALLSSALKRNGYALVPQGRVLTVIRRDAAHQADLEVVSGNDPDAVAKSDELVTQIIPVRYANASQLVNNLQVLLPATTTLSVNESANALILVAAKTDIRRMLRIVQALDSSLARLSSLQVFPLRYADAKQLATVLQQVFSGFGTSPGGANAANAAANPFGGGPGGPGGPGGFGGPPGFGPMGGGSGSGSGSGASGAGAKVVAVADDYSNSLIVSSPPGLLTTVSNLVQQIDQPIADVTEVRSFHLVNADAGELVDQIAQLFPDNSGSEAAAEQSPFRFGGPPGPFGGPPGSEADGQGGASERSRKKGRVLAVADPRTSSVLVSAPGALMPSIAKLIAELDASPARREEVHVYDLRNASAQQVSQVLQDLFNRRNLQRTTRNSQLNTDPLATRQTEQTSESSGFTLGTSGSGGGGMGGGGGGSGGN